MRTPRPSRIPPKPSRPRSLFGPKWLGLTVIALFAGMLFWSKLRVSAVVPRSAFADPEASKASEAPSERSSEPRADETPRDAHGDAPRHD